MSRAAAIVIVTRNRRDELRRALNSAIAQTGDLEVLVLDDGSTDGTSDMVRAEFPGVRLHREPHSVGLIVARNRAAELVEAPVIVSLDDDVELPDPRMVEQTLVDLDAPQVGGVAIPLVDVGRPDSGAPRAPDGEHVWVTAVFSGGANAVRRDVFHALGGYRGDFFHQGEEADLCLRMLDAGWLVRLGRVRTPILHYVSPRRDVKRMDVYGRRNELLHAWLNVPAPWVVVHLVGYPLKGLALGLRIGRPGNMVRGIGRGVVAILQARGRRRPVRRATMRVDSRLRRERAVRLEDVAPALHPPEERQRRAMTP